jgi:prolyl-tRNA synthetase
MHINTLREVPGEAELPSHIFLLRAGMIRKLVSGVYGFMPLGYRVIRKIEEIVREEMDMSGAQEIHMSAIQPSELWKESGRWTAMGPELWRIRDRHDREFCLGPTHEEIFTDIVRNEVNSYRQLPLNLYQIQNKYRDEARPRFGLMRSREFIMKDAYSFDRDEAGLEKSYDIMYEAYERIFDRCGLTYRPVEADTGAIGGSGSHEFIALSEVGESDILYCTSCNHAATSEQMPGVDDIVADGATDALEELKTVDTPDTKTIEEVATFLDVPKEKTIKAILLTVYDDDGGVKYHVTAFLRGDRELNMIKLVNALKEPEHMVVMADEAIIGDATGAVGGFTGPVGLHDAKIIVDSELEHLPNMVAGANELDQHMTGVNYGRDYKADILIDIKQVQEGDKCPICGAPLAQARGIEVGQVFKLGTKYSASMGALYKDENMQEHPIVMGCYGIGVSRTMAAIVEQHHDDNGIIWPVSVAPYHVIITLVKPDDKEQAAVADDIYEKLQSKGVEVLLDDRDDRAGVKFKDADLLGIPVRITVGKKAGEGVVEYKLRTDADRSELSIATAIESALTYVTDGLR